MWIWVGEPGDFAATGLAEWFVPGRGVSEESEYDVYLVKVPVEGREPGFERGAASLQRVDAFRRIAGRETRVEVSERLPSDAYKNGASLYPR
ncbi:MAG: hypothetical protein RMK74_12060 [Myxococcales bacterium]|nr:hypothetical protein [Myxococcales bacterium]